MEHLGYLGLTEWDERILRAEQAVEEGRIAEVEEEMDWEDNQPKKVG